MSGQHTDQPVSPQGQGFAYPQPPAQPGFPGGGPSLPAKSPKKAWFKRTWVIALAAGLVGLTLGAASAGTTDPTTTPAYQSMKDQRDQANADLATTAAELSKAKSDLETLAGDLPQREAAVKKAEGDVARREAAVTSAEKDVAKRERAVGIVETTIARNTISGDGVYQVGSDIKAGTYKTTGRRGCYYAVLNSTDTFDIANNNNVDGPAIVSVQPGQYLELSGCADWVWQQ